MNLKLLNRLSELPVLFIEKVLGSLTMELYQKKICKEITRFNRVAISACHAVGKTWLMARIVIWFLYTHKKSIVITTAPTTRQVEKLLWGEIALAIKSAPFTMGGHLTNKELKLGDKWYAMGFSPQKSAGGDDSTEQKGSTFQGWHADYVLIVFDEAVGVPHDIWTQVEGLLTSGVKVKFVCIANPTTKDCDFYNCFEMPSWRKVYLSCFDSPNLIANGITDIEKLKEELALLKSLPEEELLQRMEDYLKPVPHLLSCQWVMEKALDWGVDDSRFQSKVLGQFPDANANSIVPAESVKIAQERKTLSKRKGKRFVGIDVARFGEDSSVFTELVESTTAGQVVHTRTKKTSKKDLMETTGDVLNFIREDWEGEEVTVLIDATGLGSGVYDRLVELQYEYKISKKFKFVEFHYGFAVKTIQKGKNATKQEKTEQKTHANVKSLMYDDLNKALKKDIRLRNDSTYNAQLPTIRYKFNSSGKQLVEAKDDYKKRTGKNSPDESDSLAMANFARRFDVVGSYLKKLIGNS